MPENNEQPFKFIASNLAQKAQFCKLSWNKQCRNGHNGDDLADFCPITMKSWSILTISRYNCTILNQNCIGIGPNLAISVRICPVYQVQSSKRLLEWVIGAELETANLKGLPNVYDHCTVTAARKLAESVNHYRQIYWSYYRQIKKLSKFYIFTFCHLWTSVTAWPKCMIIHKFKEK